MPDPRIIVTSGEPAGIGPDIVAQLDPRRFAARLVVVGDRALLEQRARDNGVELRLSGYTAGTPAGETLEIIDLPLQVPCAPGQLDGGNAGYVLELLRRACQGCLDGEFDAMVTAPVQKEIINRAGIPFSGHTEFLAELCATPKPVMLLHADGLRVALVTTHLPLREVADAITAQQIDATVIVLERDLRARFGIEQPRIKVCGLNPHAGENGYLGREEIDVIRPAIESLQARGIEASGPYPADTLFTPSMLADADAVLAMYHDQGLPVLKHHGFHNAVNSTLGLPIVRTSVDHGTALGLAASGRANPHSLYCAVDSAIAQARCKQDHAPAA